MPLYFFPISSNFPTISSFNTTSLPINVGTITIIAIIMVLLLVNELIINVVTAFFSFVCCLFPVAFLAISFPASMAFFLNFDLPSHLAFIFFIFSHILTSFFFYHPLKYYLAYLLLHKTTI